MSKYMVIYTDLNGVERKYYADTYKDAYEWFIARTGTVEMYELKEKKQ